MKGYRIAVAVPVLRNHALLSHTHTHTHAPCAGWEHQEELLAQGMFPTPAVEAHGVEVRVRWS